MVGFRNNKTISYEKKYTPFFSFFAASQSISGTVKNERGEPLPFSSVIIKETAQGVTANNNAQFKLNLPSGTYTVICQHIGYEQQVKKIISKC